MMKHVAAIIILLSLAVSGGCAVVPALVTTGASLAVPQTASMVITAASTVHKTVLFAADERSADDMFADKLLTLRAQGILLTEPQAHMEATCFNGDIYLVGEFATPADRDRIITRLRSIKGVRSVKGVIKQQPSEMMAGLKPAVSDGHAETVIEAGLLKELHIRSANVDVEVVQGEAVVMGVVYDKAEAEDVIDIVKGLRPQSEHPIKVTSLLAYQDVHESGAMQANEMYALHSSKQMLAAAVPTPDIPVTESETPTVNPTPTDPDMEIDESPALEKLYARYIPAKPSTWQKARRKMKARIFDLAKSETNPQAKKELITLSTRVLKDKNVSIERRLLKTLNSTQQSSVRKQVAKILRDISPKRTERIQTLAMN